MIKFARSLLLAILLVLLCTVSPDASAQTPNTGWTEAKPISLASEQGFYPTLVQDPSGVVHAFWSSSPTGQEGALQAIVYAKYANGAWSQPADVVMSPLNKNAQFPCAVVDKLGRLHLFWLAPDSAPFGQLYHAWAPVQDAASAQSWTAPILLAQGIYRPAVALDSQGVLHLVYDAVLDNKGICYIASSDAGDTWSEATCIPTAYPVRDEEHEVRPRLAIDSQDQLHVVWVLDDYSPESKLGYASRAVFYAHSTDRGQSWSEVLTVDEIDGRSPTYDPSTHQPDWGNVAVDKEDGVHIVWVGTPDMQRYHQWSSDGGVTWSPREVAIPTGGYNQWQGIAVDSAGVLHLVWPDLRGIEHTFWTRAGGWAAPVLIPGDVGGPHYASAVVTAGNWLHVVFQSHGGGLKGDTPGLILHAMYQTGAPYVAPQPVPTVLPPTQQEATVVPETTRPAVPTHTPTLLPSPTVSGSVPVAGNSALPILAGVVPVLALVVGAVLLLARRRR